MRPSQPSARHAAAPALVLALAGSLAACGHSAPTRFFTLVDEAAPSSPPAAPWRGPPVQLAVVRIPAELDRPELMRGGAGELRIQEFAQWAGPLGEIERRTLAQDLAARLPPGATADPALPAPAGAPILDVDIASLTERDGRLVLDAAWTLTAPGKPGVADRERRGRAQLTSDAPLGDDAAYAAAFSTLTARLADALATELTATVP